MENRFIKVPCATSKEVIRQSVWKYLEDNDIAQFPRPVYNRIPNFKGAALPCEKLSKMECFLNANVIKVNPDKPQEQARFATLASGKTLLVPTPRLKHGLLNQIIRPRGATQETLRKCATREGLNRFSKPVELECKLHIDLVVLGSVAVSRQGHRIGKGEGYADLEYGVMSTVGNVDSETIVVSTVHDCQVFPAVPEDIFGEHDVTLDYILTPTEVIECKPRLPRPNGILWPLLSNEKLNEMPILKRLKYEKKGSQ